MPEALSRSQRRIVAEVMAVVESDGFVIAGGIALIAAGVSSRPTQHLDSFSPSCDDVALVAKRLVEQLRGSDHLVDVHRSDATFARMTVSTGKYRRTVSVVELRRDVQLFEAVSNALGPMLSIRELAADKMLAAFGRREPRDLVDLSSLADATSLRQAVVDARAKDPGFGRDLFVEMVARTMLVRDDLWPEGSEPEAIREFAHDVLLDPDLFGDHPEFHRVDPMRIVVVGAGAVGGVVAANLALAGTPVVAVARGEHARTMRASGLRYESPTGTQVVELAVATSVAEVDVGADDVIMLGVKGQDTVNVLNDLRSAGVTDQPIVCMQNGVDNERQALRLFPNVYGMCVMLPADHLAPGVVRVWTSPSSGLLDLGRYPHGVDDLCVQLATTLEAATFGSIPRHDIMSWKYRKLLMNLGNAIEAVCGREAIGGRLGAMVRAEGEAVLAAAGIAVVSAEDDLARRGDALTIQPVGSEPHRSGGSSWQSLQRGTGTIETDQLTGEIVLLGRLHGVATPANRAVQEIAARMALAGEPPASRSEDDVLESLGVT